MYIAGWTRESEFRNHYESLGDYRFPDSGGLRSSGVVRAVDCDL